MAMSGTQSRNRQQQNIVSRRKGGRQQSVPKFADTFPAEHPTNPHFKDFEKRLETYQTWNINLDASKEELAEAGFFYLGERDRCKCFYCNGGLQNWEKEDDPWYEHAKWFPFCEYVLQNKGFEYVEKINEQYPNLRRPAITTPPSQSQDYPEILGPSIGQQQITLPSPNNHINNMEMEYESENDEEKMEEEYDPSLQNDLMEQIQAFGFKDEIVQEVVKERQKAKGAGFQSLMELVEAIQEKEREIEENNEFSYTPFREIQTSRQVTADSVSPAPSTTLKQVASCGVTRHEEVTRKNDLLSALDEVRCAVCRVNDRNCLLLSCGHLASCYECGKKSSHCPLCGVSISGNIHKVYKI